MWADNVVQVRARIQGYDLTTRQEATLVEAADTTGFAITNPAIAGDVLYYEDTSAGHQGLFALNLATRQEELISLRGQNPVVADGILVWREEQSRGQYVPPESRLYMRQLGSNPTNTLLVSGNGWFSGYAAASDSVVWSFYPSPAGVDARVSQYNISRAISQTLSTDAGTFPVIDEQTVAWVNTTGTGPDNQPRRALLVQSSNAAANVPPAAAVVAESSAVVQPWAILGGQQLVFTVEEDPSTGLRALYVTTIGQRGLHFVENEAAARLHSTAASDQVYASGRRLYLAGERFNLDGVQFFLTSPGLGINAKTFRQAEFSHSSGPIQDFNPVAFVNSSAEKPDGRRGARAYFMDRARNGLHAQTLRIYVDLPGDGDNRGATNEFFQRNLYRFAREADQLGLRLGVVIHNSANFEMTTQKRDWISEFIRCFRGQGVAGCGTTDLTRVIAYVSADNEINRHCDGGDQRNCYADQSYANAANNWVFEVKEIFDDYNNPERPIPVTVGLSTEIGNVTLEEMIAIFTDANATRQLDQIVNFISPHNYGGGGRAIFREINAQGILNPVVLEEYGFATDPIQRIEIINGKETAIYREEVLCRQAPYTEECNNTATQFVEANIDAIQEENFAGGVAFMLADVFGDKQGKNCNLRDRERGMVPDYFSGLYTVGGDYCGGTYIGFFGMPKTTAFRVCLHHTGNDINRCKALEFSVIFLPFAGR